MFQNTNRRNDGRSKEPVCPEREGKTPSEKEHNINSTVAGDSDCDGYGGYGGCAGCRCADGHAVEGESESESASRGGIRRGASGG